METIKELIKEELERADRNFSGIIDNNKLFNELKLFLKTPSKKIRTILALLYLKANHAKITDDVINIISAGELIHNASLLHDDVIDESEFRRGVKTIAYKISPKVSVLYGDYLITKAVNKILNINNCEILSFFTKCTEKMSEAELLQMSLRNTIPSEDNYIKICEGKTASLYIAILKSVSKLTGLDTDIAQMLAKEFGIFFQIKNDLNKDSAINDKQNGVKTAYDIFGIEKTKYLTDNYIVRIESILENFPENQYKQSIKELLRKI